MGYAIRTPTHRLIEWRDFSSGEVVSTELYSHEEHHREDDNIADRAPEELLESLRSRLHKTHPRRTLRMTPAVHSSPSPGRFPVPIRFSNRLETDAFVYPITPAGRRGRQIVLPPGRELAIRARIGGVFVVESRDGSIHQIHSPSYPQRVVTLTPVRIEVTDRLTHGESACS